MSFWITGTYLHEWTFPTTSILGFLLLKGLRSEQDSGFWWRCLVWNPKGHGKISTRLQPCHPQNQGAVVSGKDEGPQHLGISGPEPRHRDSPSTPERSGYFQWSQEKSFHGWSIISTLLSSPAPCHVGKYPLGDRKFGNNGPSRKSKNLSWRGQENERN